MNFIASERIWVYIRSFPVVKSTTHQTKYLFIQENWKMVHSYQTICIVIIFAMVQMLSVCSFPESASPVMVAPTVERPDKSFLLCSINILTANCSSWDQVSSQLLEIPTTCLGPWSKIIFELHASEKGTQFDRYGAVWIGDIEIIVSCIDF